MTQHVFETEEQQDAKRGEVEKTTQNATQKSFAEPGLTERGKFTLLQVIGFNTMNMFGTGPLITIPYCLASVDPMGPHAMIGYAIACLACACDSMVWAELGSMWSKSGGPYVYLRQLYGEHTWGRLVSFMYVWQFFVSCPAEVASGFIAVAEYLVYFDAEVLEYGPRVGISLGCLSICSFLLYRKIDDIGRVTTVLWAITVGTILYVLIAGFSDFHSEYFKTPKNAFTGAGKVMMTVAAATRFGVYDMTGYYDVCFMGGVVQNPVKNIPISCIGTCCIVACVYLLVYVAVLGHLDWTSFVQIYADDYDGDLSQVGIISTFSESRVGSGFACFMTVVVAITIFGSTFSMLCGQPYVPYAAAKDGVFFRIFAHESKRYPGVADLSLLVIVILSGAWCFFSLDTVIDALVTMIVFVQFIGQSVGLIYFRWRVPRDLQPPGWRMPLYPLPCIIQIVIFSFIWITTDSVLLWGSEQPILELAVAFLCIGPILFLCHARCNKTWPFNIEIDDLEVEAPKVKQTDEAVERADLSVDISVVNVQTPKCAEQTESAI